MKPAPPVTRTLRAVSFIGTRSRSMSLSNVSGNSTSFHQGQNIGRNMPPVIPQFNVTREPDHRRNLEFSVPPPNININPQQQPSIIKPDFSSQSNQIRYPKSALNRSEEGVPAPWTRDVSPGSSFNFGGPKGNQVCLFLCWQTFTFILVKFKLSITPMK